MKYSLKDRWLDRVRNKKQTEKAPALYRWALRALLVFVAIAVIGIIKTQAEIREQRDKLEKLSAECQLQMGENEALDELLRNGSEYIERRAREDLDMVLPGERVYIIRAGS